MHQGFRKELWTKLVEVLIIDEISMVSAKLLADIDTKLRSLARDVDLYARDKNGVKRPFAGVNILCSGDFWQLPPPEGGLLGGGVLGGVVPPVCSGGCVFCCVVCCGVFVLIDGAELSVLSAEAFVCSVVVVVLVVLTVGVVVVVVLD